MGKSVVITGANRGIGLGMVKELLKTDRVSHLFATARNPSTADELRAISDPRLIIVEMDVESDESVYKGVQQVYFLLVRSFNPFLYSICVISRMSSSHARLILNKLVSDRESTQMRGIGPTH